MSGRRIAKKLYQVVYKLTHRDVRFQDKVEFGLSCIFGGENFISFGSDLRDVELGYGSYIGDFTYLRGVRIGKYTSVGPYVRTYIGKHPTDNMVSTHPAFYSVQPVCGLSYVKEQKFEEVKFAYNDGKNKYPVNIGCDVWIGAGTSILDGITIGNGAIIGANSLITENVAPYSIVAGTPAKLIRMRFSDSEIEWLQNLNWWDKENSWIVKYSNYFEAVEALQNAIKIKEDEYES